MFRILENRRNSKDTNFAAYSDRDSLWVFQNYGETVVRVKMHFLIQDDRYNDSPAFMVHPRAIATEPQLHGTPQDRLRDRTRTMFQSGAGPGSGALPAGPSSGPPRRAASSPRWRSACWSAGWLLTS